MQGTELFHLHHYFFPVNFLYQSELSLLCFYIFQSCLLLGRLVSALCIGFLSRWNRRQATSLGGPATAFLGLPLRLRKLRPDKLDAAVL